MGPFFALSGFAGRFLFAAQRAALVQTPDFRGVGKSPLLFLGVGASGSSLLRGSFFAPVFEMFDRSMVHCVKG